MTPAELRAWYHARYGHPLGEVVGRILGAAWAPFGLFMDWRYRRFADRLNGGDDA